MVKSYCLFLFFLLLSGLSFSQGIDDEITLLQAEFEMDKKQLIEAYMDLPESLAVGFWKVYRQYELERQMLSRERMLIINEYLEKVDSLDDETADDLALRTLRNDMKLSKLRKDYYKKFKKATSEKQAARFLQVDIYIHNTIRNLMQEDLPFINPN
jgi:hypothetical protein